jgi:thioredoxin reductase (NADPH)
MSKPETPKPASASLVRPLLDAARTVIMTVDDDPGVSRAIARDLRRRYGGSYRIVRAESGESALEALRELKLRGDLVAVILADYRMPQMNGIEFLEQALDVYPGARRVLLTAYADSNAAIDAINVVDLDHYLLKPWDPPEEKLYPVLDDLLEAWRCSDFRPVPSTKVVGHRWSARSSDVREFLARNQVPYRWYSTDEPEGRRLLTAAGQDGQRLPVVITADGTVLVEPEVPELAAHVGLATTPTADFYDLVVIGGGPAGLGAAVYGASEGLRTVLVERSATGGQAGQSSRIENYLGFPDGVSGGQLTDRARRQATKFGAEILTAREVTGLQSSGAARLVRFADGSQIAAHSVILATGVSYRCRTCRTWAAVSPPVSPAPPRCRVCGWPATSPIRSPRSGPPQRPAHWPAPTSTRCWPSRTPTRPSRGSPRQAPKRPHDDLEALRSQPAARSPRLHRRGNPSVSRRLSVMPTSKGRK